MSLIQSLPEKLQLKDEKNLLIQGLPSSVEKQFIKFSFAKNVTPLLKARKIDFAIVFSINQNQLKSILKDVVPALREDAKLWVAYPKLASKIVSDLSRECSWDFVCQLGMEITENITLDHVWNAVQFKKAELELIGLEEAETTVVAAPPKVRAVEIPDALKIVLNKNKQAAAYYESLPFTHKREYVQWITEAKKEETQHRRAEKTLEMLVAGKRMVSAK